MRNFPTSQPLLQLGPQRLVSRLAQKREHVLLVSLHAGLVEGVDPQQIARYAAGELEEVNERADAGLVPAPGLQHQVGHAAVHVSQQGAATANAMYMHRNTINNKVNQIKKLIQLNLDEPRLSQRLLLSCQIMRYYEIVMQREMQ